MFTKSFGRNALLKKVKIGRREDNIDWKKWKCGLGAVSPEAVALKRNLTEKF